MKYSVRNASVWNICGYAYLVIVSFVSTRWLLHGLGIPVFAIYLLVVAVVNLLSSLDLGLSQATIRLLAQAKENREREQNIWSTARILFLVDSLLVAAIAHLIGIFFLHTSSMVQVATDLLVFLTALLSLYSTFPQARGRFDLYNIRTFLVGTSNTLLVGYAAIKGYGILGLLGILGLSTLITLLFYSLYIFRELGKSSTAYDRNIANELLRFGLKNQLGKLVGQAQAQYGKFILIFLSPLAVSAYGISRGVVMNLAGGVTQVATALYPASSQAERTQVIRSMYHRLQAFLFAGGIIGLILFYWFGFTFLTWWLGNPELVAIVYPVMTILVWYLAILLLTPLASVILDSHGYPGVTSFFVVITVGLEITLAIMLMPKFGFQAPAIAALVSAAVTTPFVLWKTEIVMHKGLK